MGRATIERREYQINHVSQERKSFSFSFLLFSVEGLSFGVLLYTTTPPLSLSLSLLLRRRSVTTGIVIEMLSIFDNFT